MKSTAMFETSRLYSLVSVWPFTEWHVIKALLFHDRHSPSKESPCQSFSLKRRFPVLPILLLTILISANLQVIRAADSDSFGYTYTDSKTSGGPTYNWIEISGTGTQLAPGNNVNLAFPFTFYGTLFSQVTGFNGQLSFGQSSFIAPYLSSFGTNVGNVYYQTLGTAPNRTFVVEWSNFGPPGGCPTSFGPRRRGTTSRVSFAGASAIRTTAAT